MLPTFQRNTLLPSSALKKKAACSAESQLSFYQTAQYQIPVTTTIVTGKKSIHVASFCVSGSAFKYGCQMFQYQNIYGTLNTVRVQHYSDFDSNL